MSDVNSLGNPDEVISSIDFLREVDNDIDHRVDQYLFARSRLFDMLIGIGIAIQINGDGQQ